MKDMRAVPVALELVDTCDDAVGEVQLRGQVIGRLMDVRVGERVIGTVKLDVHVLLEPGNPQIIAVRAREM